MGMHSLKRPVAQGVRLSFGYLWVIIWVNPILWVFLGNNMGK